MTEYRFHLKGEYEGGRDGAGTIDVHGLKTKVSFDSQMGGQGVGTNPDEMLVGSVATCYMMTLAARLTNRNINYVKTDIESEGIVVKDDGLRFEQITHYPTITLDKSTSSETIKDVTDLAYEAESHCMIGNALRGNVDITVHPQVVTEKI
ncbi:OsmC family protein [Tuberibacillus sp. Marseille-P3662]|uniref:OsmC family protein n=1 Tax=Tuberibacillus sp. Marseille-P3662 TaxID=1965358 RepID=UPI001594C404|nr:OsmC family protein [Tuberibacillus sp. Marseille-P3662]